MFLYANISYFNALRFFRIIFLPLMLLLIIASKLKVRTDAHLASVSMYESSMVLYSFSYIYISYILIDELLFVINIIGHKGIFLRFWIVRERLQKHEFFIPVKFPDLSCLRFFQSGRLFSNITTTSDITILFNMLTRHRILVKFSTKRYRLTGTDYCFSLAKKCLSPMCSVLARKP